MITHWYGQITLMVILWLIMKFIRRLFPRFWPARLHLLDVECVLLLIGAHFLSVQVFAISVLPFIAVIIAVMGLLMAIVIFIKDTPFRITTFFIRIWRLLDLLMVVTYVGLLVGLASKFI
ncbi:MULTISPECIES: DUF3397 family protein [unclassified Ligilactobacillus]|uniref:DUF3397 family protein n=1 Tax=unclassified Ligilactobacillus TaxID=2767920 RepID=UPI003852CDA5